MGLNLFGRAGVSRPVFAGVFPLKVKKVPQLKKSRTKWAAIIDGNFRQSQIEGQGTQFYWGEFDVPADAVSIPRLVDEKSAALRKEYLSLIHDISETLIEGKSIREHLKISNSFSFWWMTMVGK